MRHVAWIAILGLTTALGLGACKSDIEGDVAGECSDGADNDRDGAFDCDDSDCAGAPACKGPPGGGGSGAGGAASTREWLDVASGGVHSCGIETDGTVLCWGNDADGQSTPPAGTFDAARVSFFHSCARTSAGALACWGCKGTKDYGQCDVPLTLLDADFFDTGTYSTCAVSSVGTATCWGCTGANQGQCTPPADTFDQITVGSVHACGIVAGAAVCWGNDDYGQSTPPADTFLALDAGTWHTCGVRADKSVACWGCNSPGPTQPADFGQCDAPAGSFDQVQVGVYHSCGLKTDGTVVCWGCIGDHDGTATDAGQCTPPAGSYAAIGVGKYHGCAMRADRTVACWGDNYFGQLDVP
ncbi:MAG: hypothetical protein HY908_03540 [Myxococcales bacterium]|nr:hypothetical protein [Myxococcales bacterium]